MSRRFGAVLAAFAMALGFAALLPAAPRKPPSAPPLELLVRLLGRQQRLVRRPQLAGQVVDPERASRLRRRVGGPGACGSGTPTPVTRATRTRRASSSPRRSSSRCSRTGTRSTYNGLKAALAAYPAFANTGGATVSRQEAAAFLANVSHETGGLVHIVEQNTANYPHYCDSGQPYGCPAGQAAYYGRGPIQLSWNFNYKAAGDALGIDLLRDPYRVERDAAVAWMTALWYWNTQSGPGTMTGHHAMVTGAGFGQTIRSINGTLECDGRNPAQVQSRVTKYQQFTQVLGVPTGANLC